MELYLTNSAVNKYISNSQRARVLTESWVDNEIYCPNCGQSKIDRYPNNRPVADFQCTNCREEYELKSKQSQIGTKVLDGAYRTMIERLTNSNNPNLFLLSYSLLNLQVTDLMVVPEHFFVKGIIEKRKPLSPNARRADWVGSNILLNNIPQTGKIYYIRNKRIEPKEKVLAEWEKTLFLREEKEVSEKGWLLDTMRSIEKLGKRKFTLDEIYAFENELGKLHPNNKHIKDKIRQQLQILRDKGYLEFTGRGYYRIMQS